MSLLRVPEIDLQSLIFFMRTLLNHDSSEVFSHFWEIRSDYGTESWDGNLIFPEVMGRNPLKLTGMELLVRLSRSSEFAETEIARLSDGVVDLLFFADTGHNLIIDTSSKVIYELFLSRVRETSSQQCQLCFI